MFFFTLKTNKLYNIEQYFRPGWLKMWVNDIFTNIFRRFFRQFFHTHIVL